MKRPLFWFGLIFLVCAAAAASVSRGAGIALGLALAFAALVFGGVRARSLAYIAALAVLLEWTVFAVYDRRLAGLEGLRGASLPFAGYVSRVGASGGYAVRAPVEGVPREVWLFDNSTSGDYEVGDWVGGTLVLRGAQEAPAGYLLSGGVALLGGCDNLRPCVPPENTALAERLLRGMTLLRARALAALAGTASGSASAAETAVVTGALFSDTGELPETVLSAAYSVGAGRYLSVAGFQLAFCLGLLPGGARSRRGRLWRFALGCGIILTVCAAGGFSPYLLRAGFMQLVALFAALIGRRADRLSALSLSAVLLCCLSPALAGTAGLWLSFSAALGAALLAGPLYELFSSRFTAPRAPLRWVLRTASALVSAQLALMPAYAVFFGRAYPLSLGFHLLFMPLMLLVLPLGALSLCFTLLGASSAGAALLGAAGLPARLLLWLVSLSERLPLSALRLPFWWQWLLALLIALLFGAALLLRARVRLPRIFAAAGVLCFAALAVSSLALSERTLLVCDSRTGSALLSRGEASVLFDASSDDYERGLTADMLRLYGGGELLALAAPPYATLTRQAAGARSWSPRLLCAAPSRIEVLRALLPDTLLLPLSEAPLDIGGWLALSSEGEYMITAALGDTKVLKLWAGYDIIQADDIPPGTDIVVDLRGRAYAPGGAAVGRGLSRYSVALLD